MGRVQWETDTVLDGKTLSIDGVTFKFVSKDFINLISGNHIINNYIDYIIEHNIKTIADLQLRECELFTELSAMMTDFMKQVKWYRFNDLWEFLHTDDKFHKLMSELLYASFYRDETLFGDVTTFIPLTEPMLYYNKLLKCNLRAKILPKDSDADVIAYYHKLTWEAYNR